MTPEQPKFYLTATRSDYRDTTDILPFKGPGQIVVVQYGVIIRPKSVPEATMGLFVSPESRLVPSEGFSLSRAVAEVEDLWVHRHRINEGYLVSEGITAEDFHVHRFPFRHFLHRLFDQYSERFHDRDASAQSSYETEAAEYRGRTSEDTFDLVDPPTPTMIELPLELMADISAPKTVTDPAHPTAQ